MAKTRKLKILHGPSNVASVAAVLARAQRKLGFEARSICHSTGRGVKPDAVLGQPGPAGQRFLPFMAAGVWSYDFYHFYYDETYFGRSFSEINWLKKLGKKVVLTFLGCDVRDSKAELAKTGPSICSDCWPQGCSRNRLQLLQAAKLADKVYVTTPDLKPYVPNADWLPLPVADDLLPDTQYAARRFSSDRPLTVFHAPTDPQKKGTSYLEAAVQALAAEGYPIRMTLAGDIDQADMWQEAASCDLAVDQLLSGVYGTFGAEMMLAGIPLISRIDLDVWDDQPDGIISASPDSIRDTLLDILEGRIDLQLKAEKAKVWAYSRHRAESVARKLIDDYALSAAG